MSSLAPFAASDMFSIGRQHSEPLAPHRNEYQRDCARIMRSNTFCRLAFKTQTLVNFEGEASRACLTLALMIAQLSRTIARALKLNEDLAEAIALGYELGQTPFGYAGQIALNQCLQAYGGFEQSFHALRIVDEIEEKFPNFRGLNLMFETREGILRQSSPKQAKALGTVGARFASEEQPTPPSLEAQVAILTQEIAQNYRDIEDGLRARVISIRQLREQHLFEEYYVAVITEFPHLSQRRVVSEAIRRLLNAQMHNVIETSHAQLDALQPKSIEDVRLAAEYMITLSAAMYEKHLELTQFFRTQLYQHYRVRRAAFKAQQVIRQLFELFSNDPYLLPLEAQLEVQRLQAQLGSDVGRVRAVADYIAAMTDRDAILEYERLFNPTHLSPL